MKTKQTHEKLFHVVKRAEMPRSKAIIIRIAAVTAALLLCIFVDNTDSEGKIYTPWANEEGGARFPK